MKKDTLIHLAIVAAIAAGICVIAVYKARTVRTRPSVEHLAGRNLAVVTEHWWPTRDTGVLRGIFTIVNDGDRPVKDILLSCRAYGQSGTAIDRVSRTVYQVFPPHSHTTLSRFDVAVIDSQTDQISCSVEDFKLN